MLYLLLLLSVFSVVDVIVEALFLFACRPVLDCDCDLF